MDVHQPFGSGFLLKIRSQVKMGPEPCGREATKGFCSDVDQGSHAAKHKLMMQVLQSCSNDSVSGHMLT